MVNFKKIAATARSLSHRKLVYGVGVNDSWFMVEPTIDGKRVIYQPYRVWNSMLQRCYDSVFQNRQPTYIGCTVCEEWHLFSAFEAWMLAQEFEGLALDKDIINQGNKIYSPATCRFISKSLNSLLTAHNAARGDYPMGVSWHEPNKKYQATIRINGKKKYLGYFQTASEAKAAYDKAKYAEIKRHALMQSDSEIKSGLLNWVV